MLRPMARLCLLTVFLGFPGAARSVANPGPIVGASVAPTTAAMVLAAPTDLNAESNPREPATVVHIADGDTITVKYKVKGTNRILRLYGVDCPEMSQLAGSEARDFTVSVVKDKDVLVEADDVDRYGRLVALVYLPDGRCLNDQILLNGQAWFHHPASWIKPTNLPRTARLKFMAAEMTEASKKGLGLWRNPNPMPPWRYRHSKESARVGR